MQDIWKKLNLKNENTIMILNSPESFESEINLLESVEVIRDKGSDLGAELSFFLFFVQQKQEIAQIAQDILLKTSGDVIAWFCYPKGTSKNYSCDFNRDNGWDALKEHNFSGVRQVAIDQDWSALRFRRTQYIKSKK